MSELSAPREKSREQSQDFPVAEGDDLDITDLDITDLDITELDVTELDVVVIGAGIAGLIVATRLIKAGLRCRVLERNDRAGGRLLTHHNVHGHFDLGATWYWPGETRVAELIRELDVPTHAHHLAGDAMYHSPDGAQRINGNPIDVVSGRFSHGAASLTDRLAEYLDDVVTLGATVSSVEQQQESDVKPNALTVTYTKGSVTARHVVLALPPSMAANSIRFDPTLPDDLAALAKATPVWMGNIAKVVAIYEHAFWQQSGLSGSAISHTGPLREIHDMSGAHFEPSALFGFIPLSPDIPAPGKKDIIKQLVEIFGPEAASPLEVLIKDWRTEASFVGLVPGERTPMETYAHHRYQVPFGNGRIHWASTETSPISPGHIEGALAAAERAVAAIIQ